MIAATAVVFTVRFLLKSTLGEVAPLLLFTLSVMVSAWFGGLGPGLLATALGALLGDYFFIEPFYSFRIYSGAERIEEVLFLGVGLSISILSQARLSLLSKRQHLLANEQKARRVAEDAKSVAEDARRAAEDARRAAEDANRLKDEFLSTVSHELRTPLTAINGWALMLRAGRLNAAETARALETIVRGAKAQNQIINDLLDVSRIVTGRMRLNVAPLKLGPVIEAESPRDSRRRFSLLRRHPEARTLSLHRLAQAVLRDEMDDDTGRLWAERAVRAVNEVFPAPEYSNWPSCDRLIRHVLALAPVIEKYGFDFPEATRLLNQAGCYFSDRGQYEEAEPLYERALAIREKALGAEHPDVANSLNNLASLYNNQRKYEKAEPLLVRALAIREKALGAEHPDVANSLYCLAWHYDQQKKYAQAEPLYQRALSNYEKAVGPEHPLVARLIGHYASSLRSMNKNIGAENLEARASAVHKRNAPR